jgi:chemotaxis protein methyltransferase CheR
MMMEEHPLPLSDMQIEIKLLLEAIFLKYQYDFRQYAFSSVYRRVNQSLTQMGFVTISSLTERIIRDPDAFFELLQFLTIPATEMFRDPLYFQVLRSKVIPLLKTYPSLRVWIAGCSTGEEVYSVAILFKEEGLLERTQIYATDINPKSLSSASQGIYSLDKMSLYSKNYLLSGGHFSLSDYYVAHDDAAQMDRSLIKNVVFADHSLATDNVFCEMQFISCRNVLIYFDRELQDRAVRLFVESLGSSCYLGIGPKESLRFSKYHKCFEEFDSETRIYRKTGCLT